MEVTLTQKITS